MILAPRQSRRPDGRRGGVARSPSTRTRRHALPRVVFVVGPTSSGKTNLGLRLALELGGEVVNADARQVYRDVDIGTGKPPGKRRRMGSRGAYMVPALPIGKPAPASDKTATEVPHYLMDFLPPNQHYTVAEWRDAAMKAIRGITRRGKLPIVVGGTGLYISALVDNYQFPRVEPQPAMRDALASKSLDDLVKALLVADPGAETAVDLKNKRRVIRALEVVTFSGQKFSEARSKAEPLVDAFQIAVRRTPEELYRRMEATIDDMFARGLVSEVRRLIKKKVPPTAPAMTSIGYNDIARHLRGEIALPDVVRLVKRRTRQYTKRQITWFKRDARIHWVSDKDEASAMVKTWMRKKRNR